VSVYSEVIAGTDGSRTATEAVERAAVLAERIGAPLLVATVFHRGRPEDFGPPSEHAASPQVSMVTADFRAAVDIAHDAAARARKAAPGVDVDTATPEGDPAEQLLELAESRPGSLLAVGSQGLSSSTRFLLGNVPHKISHHAVGDVLIIRTDSPRPTRAPERILIAVDGSNTAGKALRRAIDLAAAAGTHLSILTVTDDEERGRQVVTGAGRAAAAAGIAWEPVVRRGDPAEQIVAGGDGHDLVVVGNKGMTGASRFLLGSVPNKVSHHATTDLLIVKTRT
jgi:nucleotide-binding universal stress UspA family protein